MKFKAEIKYLNITNYPSVERYLESMAKEGWLVKKIIMGSLFIFKKIEPKELEFSISPYEIETAYTRKSKSELKEYKDACEKVGWNYCTSSFDLHIYYKEKDSESVEIHTDKEIEFNLLEQLSKKQLKSMYIFLPILILITYSRFVVLFNNSFYMKSGLIQLPMLIMLIGSIAGIAEIVQLRKFLKKNSENLALGKEIEYNDSKFYINKVFFSMIYLTLIVCIIYIFYSFIFLRNKVTVIALIPIVVGLTIGLLYRKYIKPSKMSKGSKKVSFVLVIIVATVIGSGVGTFNIDNLLNQKYEIDRDKYKILLIKDFKDENLGYEDTILEDTSVLVPRSYEYINRFKEESIETSYSKTLNKKIAIRLMDVYKKEAINDPIERIGEKSISKIDNNIWNIDEGYFLKSDKTKIVLRKDKEIFLLDGKDFEDEKVIEIVKEKLGL